MLGSMPKIGMLALLVALGGGALWTASAQHQVAPLAREKMDLLVFEGGRTLEGDILREDEKNYYVKLERGTTTFSKQSVTEVKYDAYEAPVSKRPDASFTRWIPKIQTGKGQKRKNEVLERQLQWEKTQAQTLAAQNLAPSAPASDTSASAASTNSDSVSGIFDERTYFGPPCPYAQE